MHLIAPHRKASVRALDVVTLHWKKNGVTTLEKEWRDNVITWQHCNAGKPTRSRDNETTPAQNIVTT